MDDEHVPAARADDAVLRQLEPFPEGLDVLVCLTAECAAGRQAPKTVREKQVMLDRRYRRPLLPFLTVMTSFG